MKVTLNFLQTILFLMFLLFIDDKIRKRVRFFRESFVPSLFIGGCLISLLNFLFSDIVVIILDQSVSALLVTLFFVSIGLRYTSKSFLEGVGKQILFLILAVCIAIFQNVFVIIWGHIFPAFNDNIMIHGSMMLMGDGELSMKLMSEEYLQILSGIETFTVIFGTAACSFTFKMLAKRKGGLNTIRYQVEDMSRNNLILHVTVFAFITALSFGISRISIFSFLYANGVGYILGLFIRWGLDRYQIYKIDNGYVNKLGNYFLAMFIMLKFSSLNLSALKYLELENIIILLLQIVLLMLFSYYIVYKLYKKDTLAVYVSAALVGYSVGIPPSTMSVLQHAGREKGTLHHVVLIVPIVGAWLIGLINPHIINMLF